MVIPKMVLRTLIITCYIFVTGNSVFSQFIYYSQDDLSDLPKVQSIVNAGQVIRDSLKELGFTAETFIIHEVDEQLLMTIDGRLDVFIWNENYWKNIYDGTYHGYNYKSQKFVYNGKLYSYRGYGFWREHGEIIEFLPEKGEWEIIHASKDLPFGVGYVLDSIYYIHSEKCFEVELSGQIVRPVSCKYSIQDEVPHGREYNFRDYILIASFLSDGTQFPLVEKESGKIFLSRRQPFKGLRDSRITNSFIHVWENEMSIIYPDNSSVKYSIDKELQYYTQELKSESFNKSWIWAIVAVSIISIVLIFHRRFSHSEDQPDLEIILAFNDYTDKLINSDLLDQILDIDNISVHETRKHKRASLIREINTQTKANYGKALIVREKDPNDKRFYLYRIQPI